MLWGLHEVISIKSLAFVGHITNTVRLYTFVLIMVIMSPEIPEFACLLFSRQSVFNLGRMEEHARAREKRRPKILTTTVLVFFLFFFLHFTIAWSHSQRPPPRPPPPAKKKNCLQSLYPAIYGSFRFFTCSFMILPTDRKWHVDMSGWISSHIGLELLYSTLSQNTLSIYGGLKLQMLCFCLIIHWVGSWACALLRVGHSSVCVSCCSSGQLFISELAGCGWGDRDDCTMCLSLSRKYPGKFYMMVAPPRSRSS